MERINTELAKKCREFKFESSIAKGPEEAEKIIAQDKSAAIDGYIVYQLNCWNRVVQTVVATGKPVLYADFQYGGSGGFLVYTAGFLRNQAPNLGFVASSRMEDLNFKMLDFQGEFIEIAEEISEFTSDHVPNAINKQILIDNLQSGIYCLEISARGADISVDYSLNIMHSDR